MSWLRDLFSRGSDTPPSPEQASADDVARYNQEWAQRNPGALVDEGTPASDGPMMDSPYAKDDSGLKQKAQFPWLYEPEKGVRWDFDPIKLRNLSQENTWVGMLVQTIAKEVAEAPWTITRGDDANETRKRLTTHPDKRRPIAKADTVAGDLPDATAESIADLLRNPNPEAGWHDAVEMWLSDLLEVGSASVVKYFPKSAYGDDDQLVTDAENLRPRGIRTSAPEVWTKDFHGRTGHLQAFWQFDHERSAGSGNSEGGTSGSYGFRTPVEFDVGEIMWTDMSPRSNRRYGLPPTLLVEDFLQSVDLALKQEQQYLSRGSIPSGAWVFENWDREHIKEWKTENAENIKGKPHKSLMFAGRGGDVSFEPMSMNFKELEFTERQKWYARIIASVFQVPTAVVGVEPEKVNYNTFQGERENFEENTLGPYLMKLERFINDELIEPHWGENYHFEFKPGISETTRRAMSERVRAEWDANLIKRSTALQDIGRELPDDAEDGYKEDLVDDSGDGPLDGLQMSVSEGDSGNAQMRKDEPLRETDEWYQFDVQPGDVEALREDIADDIQDLYDRVLSDRDIQRIIERLAADEETEKSATSLARELKDLLQQTRIAGDIADAIREQTADAVAETVEDTITDVDEAPDDDVDVEAIRGRLRDRDIGFANSFADSMAEDIRETVGDGWAEGKNSRAIAEDIADQGDIKSGWNGAEKIARQELQVATGEARTEVAAELEKVEVWQDSGDDRVRPAHADMSGSWKRPGESWSVDYSTEGRGVKKESVPGDSEPGIGCRCFTLLRDIEEVDDADHTGV